MTRMFSLMIAAMLMAGPGSAGGMAFDLPNLTFPPTEPVTPSTSGPVVAVPAQPQR